MVAFHTWHGHFADNFEAFFGICVIANDVSDAGVMSAPFLLGVFQHSGKGFEISVNVPQHGIFDPLPGAVLTDLRRRIRYYHKYPHVGLMGTFQVNLEPQAEGRGRGIGIPETPWQR